MKLKIRAMILTAILICPSLLLSSEKAATTKHVLLINSYQQGYKWTDDITAGIQQAFKDRSDVMLSIEYLDSKKQFSQNYRKLLAELFFEKMKNTGFDLIIVSDNNALDFLLENDEKIFKSLPAVFCGINEFHPEDLGRKKNITGINEDTDFYEGITLIKRLHPKTKNIKFIIDSSQSAAKILVKIKETTEAMKGPISFEIIHNLPMNEIVEKVRNAPDDCVIFFTFFSTDSEGRFYRYNESLKLISETSKVPVYGAWDFSIGDGIVGGYVISGFNQGEQAGKMALEILGGKRPENMPVKMKCEKNFIFDYNQLRKLKIDEKKLPKGSEIFGMPKTFYSQNKNLVLNVSLYIAVLLLIIFILAVNMSARISAEKSLIKTKNFLHDIIESMPSMLITIDENRTIVSFNKKVSDFSGLNPGLIKDGNLYKVFPDFTVLEPLIYMVFEKNRNIFNRTVDLQYRKTSLSTLVSVYHLTGSITREVVIRIDDVTEKVRNQEEMSKLKNLLADATNSMSSMIAAVDENMNIMQWNSAAEKISGKLFRECKGKKLSDVYPAIRMYSRFIEQSISSKTNQEFIKVPIILNNETRYFDILIFPLTGKNNIGAVIRIDDVTERTKMEEVLIQSEKMMSVGGLAAGMAHEINNPLAGIMQGAQMLQLAIDPVIPKNIKVAEECGLSLELLQNYFRKRNIFRIIETIVNSVQRAADIVTNMLSFSRKTSTNMEFVNIAELVDRTIELAKNDYDLKKKYDFKKIEINKRYDQPLQLIKCHPSEIQQVIFNILKNGAQAMMDSTNTENDIKNYFFNINIIQKKHVISIEIEDNGPGMSEDVRKRVFEPFFTTKTSSKGIGLGLSVSYFIITENHKGTMNVESVPGFGSKFIINLPLNGATDE